MACEMDSYTKRPRTPNDPYTVMTEEQIRNITRVRHEFIKYSVGPSYYSLVLLYILLQI